jgi:hypothetical protein
MRVVGRADSMIIAIREMHGLRSRRDRRIGTRRCSARIYLPDIISHRPPQRIVQDHG